MKCRSNNRRNTPHSLACLTATVLLFLFISTSAQTQLTPWDDTNQVFVDFSVVADSGVGRAANSLLGPSLSSLGSEVIDPPLRMPVSRLFVTRPPTNGTAAQIAEPKVKLIPPTKYRGRLTGSKRKTVSTKIQKSTAKPRVTSELARKLKSSKPEIQAKLAPTPLDKPKPGARTIKLPLRSMEPAPPAAPKITPPPSNTKKVKPLVAKLSTPKPQEKQQASLQTSGRTTEPVNVMFAPGSSDLTAAARKSLDRIATQLNSNESIRMQLMAYAGERKMSASKARRLSLSRALAVRSHLIKKGVRGTRIDVRALGNKVPTGRPNRVHLRVISQ